MLNLFGRKDKRSGRRRRLIDGLKQAFPESLRSYHDDSSLEIMFYNNGVALTLQIRLTPDFPGLPPGKYSLGNESLRSHCVALNGSRVHVATRWHHGVTQHSCPLKRIGLPSMD
jgi:hypothetical protein